MTDDAHATNGAATSGEAHPAASPAAPLGDDTLDLAALVGRWCQVQLDLVLHRARAGALRLLALAGAAVLAAAVLVTAAVLLCVGAADGLGLLLGARWAGQVVLGGGVLTLTVLSGACGLWLLRRAELNSLKAKYDARPVEQRHGRDQQPSAAADAR
jgi:hypothetical protein